MSQPPSAKRRPAIPGLLIVSGVTRMLLAIAVLLMLWGAIAWSILLP